MMTTILNREQILSTEDLPRETIEVPEWDGAVVVRALTGAERAKMIEGYLKAAEHNPEEPFYLHVTAAAICDEQGEQLFSAPVDVQALIQRNGAALERLTVPARRLNGFYRQAQKKSSMKTSSSNSGTSSP